MEIKTYSHLDWLTVSYRKIKDMSEVISQAYWLMRPTEPIKPFPHYDTAWRLECGGRIDFSESEKQGARLELTGEPLGKLRENGMPDDLLIRELAASSKKNRTTRADYCFNVIGAGSVRHTVNHWRAGNAKTVFINSPHGYVDFGSRRGQTVDFGSKKSDRFVRIYDKATQMGLLKEAWLRVELQTRNENATALTSDAIKKDMRTAGVTHLAACLDFPKLRWWQEATKGEQMDREEVRRKVTQWQKWMDGQVFESILKHVKNIDDGIFLETWLAKVALAVAAAETERMIKD